MADDDIQTPAGDAAPQADTSVVPPAEGTAEPSPAPESDAAASSEAAPEAPTPEAQVPEADAEPFKRADEEPTLLEGAETPGKEKKAEEADVDADKEEKTDAEKAEEEKTEGDGAEKKADADGEKEEGDADAEADKDTKPELEPIDYQWTLPESFRADDALKAEVHGALDQFRADPTNPQPLIDLHTRQMEQYAQDLEREQHRVFAETRADWRKEWMADPEIGGAGYETALAAIARMRDMFGSSAKPGTTEYEADLKAFDGMLRVTGVGDHPIFARFLHNVAATFDRPAPAPTEIKPPKDIGRQNARGLLYDNPRSDPNRQQ